MSGATAPNSVTVVSTDGDEEVYRTHHDLSTDGLSLTISVALAEVTGQEETELIPKFSEHADPDALNRLFRTLPNGDRRGPGHVTLHVAGFEVTVESDGHITMRRVGDQDAVASTGCDGGNS